MTGGVCGWRFAPTVRDKEINAVALLGPGSQPTEWHCPHLGWNFPNETHRRNSLIGMPRASSLRRLKSPTRRWSTLTIRAALCLSCSLDSEQVLSKHRFMESSLGPYKVNPVGLLNGRGFRVTVEDARSPLVSSAAAV